MKKNAKVADIFIVIDHTLRIDDYIKSICEFAIWVNMASSLTVVLCGAETILFKFVVDNGKGMVAFIKEIVRHFANIIAHE